MIHKTLRVRHCIVTISCQTLFFHQHYLVFHFDEDVILQKHVLTCINGLYILTTVPDLHFALL